MNNITKRSFILALAVGVFAFATSPALAAKLKTEDELITDLGSSQEKIVFAALQQLEKQYPTSTKAFPEMKKLLTDPRVKIRCKSARVLGALHAEVDATDLKNICAMFKASDRDEVTEALKALRGLKAESTVPEILPLLQNSNAFIVRDACRTLAVIGNKSNIPALEPLLSNPDSKIQKDAQDAIFALKAKP
jgi:HEAT repeat protein